MNYTSYIYTLHIIYLREFFLLLSKMWWTAYWPLSTAHGGKWGFGGSRAQLTTDTLGREHDDDEHDDDDDEDDDEDGDEDDDDENDGNDDDDER